jgi:hypothetical protein
MSCKHYTATFEQKVGALSFGCRHVNLSSFKTQRTLGTKLHSPDIGRKFGMALTTVAEIEAVKKFRSYIGNKFMLM